MAKPTIRRRKRSETAPDVSFAEQINRARPRPMAVLLLDSHIEPGIAISPDLHREAMEHSRCRHDVRQALQRDRTFESAGVESRFVQSDFGDRAFARNRLGGEGDPAGSV